MTKEEQNRFLILFSLKNLNNSASKNEALNFLLENEIILLNDNDLTVLTTRPEEKWRNELAFTRSHLVREGYLLNSVTNKWTVSDSGLKHYYDLYNLLDKSSSLIRINLENLKNFRSESRTVLNEQREIDKIECQSNLSETEKINIILSRIGQGVFRDNLFELYGSCCLSGYRFEKLLIASHIKPWRHSNNQERLDKYNGLLLMPTYDKLFDLGYISFENSGKIIISPFLELPEKAGINPSWKIQVFDEMEKYLKYHRRNIFLK